MRRCWLSVTVNSTTSRSFSTSLNAVFLTNTSGPAANPSSSVAVVSTWRSSTSSSSHVLLNAQSMVRVHGADDAGGTGIEQRQACSVHLPEPWRCLDAIEFNVDERLFASLLGPSRNETSVMSGAFSDRSSGLERVWCVVNITV